MTMTVGKTCKMDDLIRMVSAKGFCEVFWERIRADRHRGGRLTFRRCYHEMELEFEAKYGVSRFKSYDAFRKVRRKIDVHY